MNINDLLTLPAVGENAQWTCGRLTVADTLRDDVILIIASAEAAHILFVFKFQNSSNCNI